MHAAAVDQGVQSNAEGSYLPNYMSARLTLTQAPCPCFYIRVMVEDAFHTCYCNDLIYIASVWPLKCKLASNSLLLQLVKGHYHAA